MECKLKKKYKIKKKFIYKKRNKFFLVFKKKIINLGCVRLLRSFDF